MGSAIDSADVRDDLELLEAWRAGDRRAGDELFVRHFDAVYRFFRNKVDANIDDLIQKTFLTCVEKRDRFRGDSSFRTFMLGIGRMTLLRHYRDKKRDMARFDPLESSIFDLDPSPSRVVVAHKDHELLLEGLRRLPFDLQVALELHYWEGMTGAEIAEVLEVPVGTAKSRLRRGREQLEAGVAELANGRTGLTLPVLDEWAAAVRTEILGEAEPQT